MSTPTRSVRRVAALALLGAVVALGACSAAPSQTVSHIDVSIKQQTVFVYAADGTLLRRMPASTGAGGRTPLGNFRVYSRSASTVSSTDSRVSMKWMTRFNGGIGFHGIPRRGSTALATPLGQRAVSHGCVRLADADAKWIYDNVANGTPVNVIPK